ncbi:MAG: TerC family protein [Verrucomicrobia bacterium]|nr:TerC family protein [Verrucomicrobiota bacterium]
MFEGMLPFWIGFNIFVLLMLALDLGVFHRNSRTVSMKEGAIWSAVWTTLALGFTLLISQFWGRISPTSELSASDAALAFLTGYVIEWSLSVDNIFVFVLIFSYFNVPPEYRHRVLFWGILGALVMRAVLILTGSALLARFHWIIYVFGAFLIFTGLRMAFHRDEKLEPEKNPVVRLFKRFFPVAPSYVGDRFFVHQAGRWVATPLFVVLLLVESTDLIFAVDSIPAIFAVTRDPFIVYTSNVFAILGLRSMYFVLAGVMDKFHYLKLGLATVLTFVGVKMVIVDFYKIPTALSLGVVVSILAVAVFASLVRDRRLREAGLLPGAGNPAPAGGTD